MQCSIDFSKDDYGVTVDRINGAIRITLDIGIICSEVYYSKEQAKDIAEQILNELGEKTTSEWEEEVYNLQEEINDLQEQIEDYSDRVDYMRRADRCVLF